MSVPLSASEIGEIEFRNGNRLRLWVSINSNTGATRIHQQLAGGRPSVLSGRNLRLVLKELAHVLDEGEGRWIGAVNDAALDAVRREVGL